VTRFSSKLLPNRAGRLWVWDWPRTKGRYVIGADSSEGKVRDRVAVRRRIETSRDLPDYSAAVVLDVETGDHVATWHGWDNPTAFGEALFALGHEYNSALLVIERNANGVAIIELLARQLGYPNLYTTKLLARNVWQPVGDTVEYGWVTSPGSRALLMSRIHDALGSRSLSTRDRRLIDELRTMQYDELGNPRAKAPDHDDLVFAYALALQGRFELLMGTERPEHRKPVHITEDDWVWQRKDQIVQAMAARQGRIRPRR